MEIEFVAYAEDCLIRGRVDLEGERLSDMLNARQTVSVRGAVAEALDDGRMLPIDALDLERGEILAVEALGPRGNASRRVRTRSHRMQVKIGPYLVLGYLHTLPGGDPAASSTHQPPFVALTDATVVWTEAGTSRAEDVGALLVNRDRAAWIRATEEEAVAFPNVPARPVAPGARAPKDMTED